MFDSGGAVVSNSSQYVVVTVSLFPVQENSPALGRGIELSPGSSPGDTVSAVNPWWILGEGEQMRMKMMVPGRVVVLVLVVFCVSDTLRCLVQVATVVWDRLPQETTRVKYHLFRELTVVKTTCLGDHIQ